MKRFFAGIVLAFVAVAFFACGDDNSLEKLREDELATLDVFIAEHYPNSTPKASGLYYTESIKGTGDSLLVGDIVQVFYATWTIDSILMDESSGYTLGHRFEPLEFVVGAGSVITGLDEAATYMQSGTKANLVLPSELAYGQNGTTGISGFTTLLMEVEVYKVYPYSVQ